MFFCLFFIPFLLVTGSSAGTKLTGSTKSVPRQTVNGGGGVSSGPTFILGKSFGETGVSSFTGFGFKMSAGLMGMLSQPGTITSITALSKSTGTLELAWTAPGADGFLGNVVGGSWRIDASTDPNHSFSPSTFLVEFATTVVAGSRQSYRLGGLTPNTTYYSRIYLADSAKTASETSAASAESTLANVPAAPLVTGVFQTSVTVTWTLPVGGASNFQLDGSSTDFGAL
ncbi:MAG: fibronectin type III domain-containing protein, partial [Elusimicrobiota bacterium]